MICDQSRREYMDDLKPCRWLITHHRPYASPVVYVYFDSDTNPLAIPKSLFCQSLTLTNMYDRRVARNGHEAIDCDVSLEVGHVLIHYLHTGNYHCLKSTKASPQQQADDEFQTAIRVYREAQNFELKPFVELAREEIDRLGKKLSLPRVIGAVEVAWLGDVSDDTWLLNYLTDYMHSFNDNLTGHTARETSLEIGRAGHLTTSSLLLKVMLDDIFRKDPSSSTALFLT